MVNCVSYVFSINNNNKKRIFKTTDLRTSIRATKASSLPASFPPSLSVSQAGHIQTAENKHKEKILKAVREKKKRLYSEPEEQI